MTYVYSGVCRLTTWANAWCRLRYEFAIQVTCLMARWVGVRAACLYSTVKFRVKLSIVRRRAYVCRYDLVYTQYDRWKTFHMHIHHRKESKWQDICYTSSGHYCRYLLEIVFFIWLIHVKLQFPLQLFSSKLYTVLMRLWVQIYAAECLYMSINKPRGPGPGAPA